MLFYAITKPSGRKLIIGIHRRVLPSWPELRSLTFENCNAIRQTADPVPLLVLSSHLSSLNLIYSRDLVEWFLPGLPPTVATLAIDEFDWDHGFDSANSEDVLASVGQLKDVSLTKGKTAYELSHEESPPGKPRGRFEQLIAKLVNVERLAIMPAAVTHLGSLAKLDKLTHLELQVGASGPKPAVDVTEVLELFAKTTSLAHVTIDMNIAARWSARPRREVRLAALPRIELVFFLVVPS